MFCINFNLIVDSSSYCKVIIAEWTEYWVPNNHILIKNVISFLLSIWLQTYVLGLPHYIDIKWDNYCDITVKSVCNDHLYNKLITRDLLSKVL